MISTRPEVAEVNTDEEHMVEFSMMEEEQMDALRILRMDIKEMMTTISGIHIADEVKEGDVAVVAAGVEVVGSSVHKVVVVTNRTTREVLPSAWILNSLHCHLVQKLSHPQMAQVTRRPHHPSPLRHLNLLQWLLEHGQIKSNQARP